MEKSAKPQVRIFKSLRSLNAGSELIRLRYVSMVTPVDYAAMFSSNVSPFIHFHLKIHWLLVAGRMRHPLSQG